MSDKIRISWDEVNSPRTDEKLQRQDAVARATDHYQQQVAPSMPSLAGTRRSQSIWYNALVYMTCFGALGGFLAWPACELQRWVMKTDLEHYREFADKKDKIIQDMNRGKVSDREAQAAYEKLQAKYRNNSFLIVEIDDSLTDSQKKAGYKNLIEEHDSFVDFRTAIFLMISGMFIATSVSVADSVMERNWRNAIINGSVGICLGLVGGAIVGLFANKLFQGMLGTGELTMSTRVFARSVTWAIVGLFLAIAPGFVMRSPKRLFIGMAGGCAGGLVGGGLFDVTAMATGTGVSSRLVGLFAIGAVAGLGTGIIENAAKTGWLKVVGGLIVGKQFILYKNPTYIGSSPQCEIYLFKDVQVAPQHAAIRQIPQGYEIEDLKTTSGTFVNGAPISRIRLRNDDQIQIGSTAFTFHEKER